MARGLRRRNGRSTRRDDLVADFLAGHLEARVVY